MKQHNETVGAHRKHHKNNNHITSEIKRFVFETLAHSRLFGWDARQCAEGMGWWFLTSFSLPLSAAFTRMALSSSTHSLRHSFSDRLIYILFGKHAIGGIEKQTNLYKIKRQSQKLNEK